MHLSLLKRFPLFIWLLFAGLLVSDFRPDTGGGGGLLSRFACLAVLRGGRGATGKRPWRVWGALAVFRPHRVCPRSPRVCFPVYTAQAPGCSPGSGASVMCTSQPKPLRLRFSGTPQRGRLGWACVLCRFRSEELRQPGA